MNISGPIGARLGIFTGQSAASGLDTGNLRVNAGREAIATAQDHIRSAITTLRQAFATFRSATRSIYVNSFTAGAPIGIRLNGVAPSIATAAGSALVQTTRAVNTQTLTDRWSSSPLGLNLATAVSQLASAALGLDVTSSAASSLHSDDLGLDLTSPDAASLLQSAAAIGLDLTSPDDVSRLSSAFGLGLDTTSAESVSRLLSGALGLDLTSPDRASVLRSSSGLSLDTTSPQTASTNSSLAAIGLDVTSAQAASKLQSSASMGLDVTSPETSSSITSTAAVNTATTSYGANVAMSAGTSTVTLSGTFTGVGTAASTSALTVKIAANDTISATATGVHIELYDGGTRLLDFSGDLKAGDKLYLGDDVGLFISFSAGTLVNGATGTSAVSRSAPTVDTAATFDNANRNLRPLFDSNAQVTAGAFTINGTSIAVNANDSIDSVISRINASAAGVTASFANKKLTLTSNAASEDDIVLANDTSGFLSAMKLARPNGEINSAVTSYGSPSLGFTLGSSVATLTGTYTGVDAFAEATALTVKVTGALASLSATTASTLKFSVLDEGGHNLFSFSGSAKAGDKIAIGDGSGLWISFSAGSLVANETATTTVSSTAKTDVNPAATFNSSANLRPRFENGATVRAGSFSVNGTTVAVNANDSINSVLSRINATVSGVTASFSNDRISLVNNSGSNPVVLGSDTSGFLAATKLTAAVTSKGNVRDDLQVLAKTTQFAGVSSGSFTINGTAISVNKDSDSLSSIVSRINAAGAGVTAAFDATQNKLVLTTTGNSEDLITVSGSTGFLAAAKLVTGNTVRGNVRDDQQVLAKTMQFAAVTTGSFTINGVSVAVDRDVDTLTSLLGKINSAGAGVSAVYDSATDKIVLTSSSPSEDLITLADSTGFLTAARLATGNTVRGNVRDDQQVLAKTTQFAGVSSGSFSVNGTSIAINTAADSLSTIVSRINAAGAGVTAAYDTATDKLVLTGTSNSATLIEVADGGTGFLAAANLVTADTVRGHVAENGVAFRDMARFASVGSGAFTVDGKSIAVTAADSIDSIVAKINSSGARVTAAFDSSANKLSLASTDNTEDLVAIGGDTSGFLAAAGIDAANTARGNLRDDQQVLAKTTQFAGVASGAFTVNGKSIAVDKDADTVSTLLAKINAAGAGVTAAFDAVADKLVLTGTQNSEDLIAVANDSSGFLAAAQLATGNTVRGHLAEDGVALYNTASFRSVTDGSFVIDGKTIAVSAAGDTVKTVIQKINDSGARVVAAYDAAHDRISLQATYDSEDDLPLGSDTSGFLDAAHLHAVDTVRGNIRDDLQVLAKTAQFASVTNGSFSINGHSIAVDKNADTVQSLVDKINAAAAGVTASFNPGSGRLELLGTTPSEDLLDIGRDSSNFLSAAGLDPANTVRGAVHDDLQVLSKTTQFGDVVSGSFLLNGKSIAVDVTRDSLSSIVDRINGAGAGVTAQFNPQTDRLELVGTADSDDPITVGADGTGFLAATGLATGNGIAGNQRDDQQTLATAPRFAAVQSGSFDVNGVTIAVEPTHDSLRSVIQRINDAGAGVTATYDEVADRLLFAADAAGGPVVLDRDSSGFLTASAVTTGAAGTHVNADAAFNGHGSGAPLFDPGQSVQAGSFTVNGVTIAVAADDTIRSVLGKITASAAGVTAAFDDAAQTITLTGSRGTKAIAVADDTSGFLAAVKIDSTATVTSAPLSPLDKTLAEAGDYGAVRAGTLTINGESVNIDPATMTLRDVVGALNGMSDVSAALDDNTGVVTIASRRASSPLSIADASQLLDALGISAGSYTPAVTAPQLVQKKNGSVTSSNAGQVSDTAVAAVAELNDALALIENAAFDPSLGEQITTALQGAVNELHEHGISGLTVSDDPAARLLLSRDALVSALSVAGAKTGEPVDAALEQIGATIATVAQQAADTLDERVTASAPPPSMPPGFQLANQIRAQIPVFGPATSAPQGRRAGGARSASARAAETYSRVGSLGLPDAPAKQPDWIWRPAPTPQPAARPSLLSIFNDDRNGK